MVGRSMTKLVITQKKNQNRNFLQYILEFFGYYEFEYMKNELMKEI